MEIVWSKLAVWILVIIVLIVMVVFMYSQLGGNGPLSGIFGASKDVFNQPPTP